MTDPIVFPDTTARFGLPLLHVAQAQKEVFLNEALVRVDMLLQPVVQGLADEPPVRPNLGECWIVSTSPVNDFENRANHLACWQQGQWMFIAPHHGMSVFDQGIGAHRRFDDGWTVPTSVERPIGGSLIDIEAREAINAIIDSLQATGTLRAA